MAGHALTTCGGAGAERSAAARATCGEAGAGKSAAAEALFMLGFFVGCLSEMLWPRVLALSCCLLLRALRRHLSARLAFIRISMAPSSVAAARTSWMTAL